MNKEITNILTDNFSSATMQSTLDDLVSRLEKKKVI